MNRKYAVGLAAAFLFATPSVACVGADPNDGEHAQKQSEELSSCSLDKGFDVASRKGEALGVDSWAIRPFTGDCTSGTSDGLVVEARSASGNVVAHLSFSVYPDHVFMGVWSADWSQSEHAEWWLTSNSSATQTQHMTKHTTLTKIANAFLHDAKSDRRRLGNTNDCLAASLLMVGSFIVTGGSCIAGVAAPQAFYLCVGAVFVAAGSVVAFSSVCRGPVADALQIGATYTFRPLVNTASCLDVQANGPANGTQIEEYTCNESTAQKFTVVDRGNGIVSLLHHSSGRCVDLSGSGTANGTKVQLFDCNGTAAQQFTVETDASGNVTFHNPNSGRCLDVDGSNPADMTKVQLFDCNGTNAQKWTPGW